MAKVAITYFGGLAADTDSVLRGMPLSCVLIPDSIYFPIFPQCHPDGFFELRPQMALGGIAEIGGNLAVGVIGIHKKVLRQIGLLLLDKFRNGDSFTAAKQVGEITGV